MVIGGGLGPRNPMAKYAASRKGHTKASTLNVYDRHWNRSLRNPTGVSRRSRLSSLG